MLINCCNVSFRLDPLCSEFPDLVTFRYFTQIQVLSGKLLSDWLILILNLGRRPSNQDKYSILSKVISPIKLFPYKKHYEIARYCLFQQYSIKETWRLDRAIC